MKKILLFSILAIVFASCQEKKMDRFEREAKDYTAKHCPERIDDITVIDSITFSADGQDGNLCLHFSLTLDSVQEETFRDIADDVNAENLQMIRNSVQFIKYRDAGVTFTYIYTNATTGKELLRTEYTKDDYAR